MRTYRERVLACARGGTFKYFFSREAAVEAWSCLQATYGPLRRNESMKTMEIESEHFIFRSTFLGNPITVFRKRKCTVDDVERFHRLIGYGHEGGVDE